MWSSDECIAACGTPTGNGARAIVRIAGRGLDALLPRLCDGVEAPVAGRGPRLSPARLAAAGLGRVWGEVPVDVALWPGPGGPVGGPLAELHLPQCAPLVDAVVAEACRHGARLARGGEFTLRAFLAGRLDLLQAEAVVAVVDAVGPGDLAAALDRMAGGAGGHLQALRSALLDILADIEAGIDFADETTPDAVPGNDRAAWVELAARLEGGLAALDAAAEALAVRAASSAAGLPRVVLAGPPDIGKSSLFNALVGHDAALVAAGAGTTRDWLEARLDLSVPGHDGVVSCLLVDVAGLDDAEERHSAAAGTPTALAAKAARRLIAEADIVVACADADSPSAGRCTAGERPRIDVRTRCDRCAEPAAVVGAIVTSSRSGQGIDALRARLAAAVAALPPRGSPATVRLATGLAAARAALLPAVAGAAQAAGGAAADEALLAGHVHQAVAALGEVTGETFDTDLLDRIFSRHCIGK